MTSLSNGVADGVNGNKHAKSTFLFTSESVGEGHPDKIAFVLPVLVLPLVSANADPGHSVTKYRMLFSMPALPKIQCPRLHAKPRPRPVRPVSLSVMLFVADLVQV